MEKKTMYLVLEKNYGLTEVDIVEESEMKLYTTKEKAMEDLLNRKKSYQKEAVFTFVPDESSETAFVMANEMDEDGSCNGKFVITMMEIPVIA